MKIRSTKFWQEVSKNKLAEKFGERVFLGKIEGTLALKDAEIDLIRKHPEKYSRKNKRKYGIVQILGFSDYVLFSMGATPVEALNNAGLKKWVETIQLNERCRS